MARRMASSLFPLATNARTRRIAFCLASSILRLHASMSSRIFDSWQECRSSCTGVSCPAQPFHTRSAASVLVPKPVVLHLLFPVPHFLPFSSTYTRFSFREIHRSLLLLYLPPPCRARWFTARRKERSLCPSIASTFWTSRFEFVHCLYVSVKKKTEYDPFNRMRRVETGWTH